MAHTRDDASLANWALFLGSRLRGEKDQSQLRMEKIHQRRPTKRDPRKETKIETEKIEIDKNRQI